MRTQFLIVTAASALVALAATPAGAVPETVGLTARIVNGGTPAEGPQTIAIRIYDADSGGTMVWTESDATTATNGLVYLTLGDQNDLDAGVLDGGPLWVELQVGTQVVLPRLAITSAPYAVRAGVAEDAERLGGMPATGFLPRGPSLACTGSQKVAAIDGATGSVVCAADTDTNTTYTAGVGLALAGTTFSANLPGGVCPAGQKVAAINAAGAATCSPDLDTNTTYTAGNGLALAGTAFSLNLPATTCPAGQKVSAVSATGAATCTADVDTNTTYLAGTGLTLSGNTFNLQLAGNGNSTSAARSDHNHATSACPAAYAAYTRNANGVTFTTCLRTIAASATWNQATRACMNDSGASLCRYEQIIQIRGIDGNFSLTNDLWLGDRMADNFAYSTNGSGLNDDFDTVTNVTSVKPGYYCCLERRWW